MLSARSASAEAKARRNRILTAGTDAALAGANQAEGMSEEERSAGLDLADKASGANPDY